jgi:hypothetical protein
VDRSCIGDGPTVYTTWSFCHKSSFLPSRAGALGRGAGAGAIEGEFMTGSLCT